LDKRKNVDIITFKLFKMNQYFVILLSVTLVFSCSSSVTKSSETLGIFEKVELEVFNLKLQDSLNIQILDVRTPQEFQAGAIQNAVNLDFYNENFKSQLEQLDKSKPVMLYCKSGGRSGKTLTILKEMGFSEAYELTGGYTVWSKK